MHAFFWIGPRYVDELTISARPDSKIEYNYFTASTIHMNKSRVETVRINTNIYNYYISYYGLWSVSVMKAAAKVPRSRH